MRAPTRFSGPAWLTNAAATKYTVPAASLAVVRHIHISNPSGNAINVSVSIGADVNTARIFDAFSIPAAAPGVQASVLDHWCYYPVAAAEVVQAFASTTNTVTFTMSGDLITLG